VFLVHVERISEADIKGKEKTEKWLQIILGKVYGKGVEHRIQDFSDKIGNLFSKDR